MYKPSTHLVIIYFPTYPLIYETYFLWNRLPRWNHKLTQLRFHHNWVITGIQWMLHWWVLVDCGHESFPSESGNLGLEWTSSHRCTSSGWGRSSHFGDEPKHIQLAQPRHFYFSLLLPRVFSALLSAPKFSPPTYLPYLKPKFIFSISLLTSPEHLSYGVLWSAWAVEC
jgi:hypothetical protein